MALYMTQAKMATSVIGGMASGRDRREVLDEVMQAAGGRLVAYYFTFGEYDLMVIYEGVDNVSIASILMSVAGSGAVTDLKTTVLLSYEEGIEALSRASGVEYTPPGS
ncbi:MAG: GYD domain-containing protein [Trueperaceae bacterium]|nr:MAG: GYD domain-containing protein [Trueperaceae bacterium]